MSNAALIAEAMATAGSDYTTERAADSIVALITALTDSEAIKDNIKNILMDQIAELICELRGARAENARLREALKPFADAVDCAEARFGPMWKTRGGLTVLTGPHDEQMRNYPMADAFIAARQALTGGK